MCRLFPPRPGRQARGAFRSISRPEIATIEGSTGQEKNIGFCKNNLFPVRNRRKSEHLTRARLTNPPKSDVIVLILETMRIGRSPTLRQTQCQRRRRKDDTIAEAAFPAFATRVGPRGQSIRGRSWRQPAAASALWPLSMNRITRRIASVRQIGSNAVSPLGRISR